MARPSKIKDINFEQVKKLAAYGLTDKQLSDVLNISESTLNLYKKDKAFSESLKGGKKISDEQVERSLFQRACGYECDEITYEKSKTGGLGLGISQGEIQDIKHVDTYKTKVVTKKYPPETLACIFWLKNRKPEQWKDKNETEITGFKEILEKMRKRYE